MSHPRDYPINAEASARCESEVPTKDPAAELDWCWEEIAQLQAALKITKEMLQRRDPVRADLRAGGREI